jgi:hypothetical protein
MSEDRVAHAVNRARRDIDKVRMPAQYRALRSLCDALELMLLEASGELLGPGIKPMSVEQIAQMIGQRKKEPDAKDIIMPEHKGGQYL